MKRVTALLLSAFLILLPGCGPAASKGTPIQFYYAVSSTEVTGAAIRSETIWMERVTVPDVMRRLLQGPDNVVDLTKTFPDGTTLLDWSLTDGALKLDLSEAFGRLTGISMTHAEYCIVLTLTQLDGVETVTITAGGQPLPGSASDVLSVQDVILKGETKDPYSVGYELYFPLSDGSGLGAEYREFDAVSLDLEDQADAVLTQLILGPKDESMTAFLSGAGLLETSSVRGTACIVALDSVTMECICGTEEDFETNLYAIVDSLAELEGIESVIFYLNGAPVDGWAEEYFPAYAFDAP